MLFISWLCLNQRPALGIDFAYHREDCSILYRFIPRTGTLNDLVVVYDGEFEFFPSHFGGITTFILGGEELHPWEEKHTTELVEEFSSGNTYKAKFRWSYGDESFVFTLKIWLDNKALSIEFSTDSLNESVIEFGFDRSEQTPEPKIIELPYGHNVLFTKGIYISGIIDPFLSNASTIIPLKEYYSETSACYAYSAAYKSLTDGSRNPMQETIHITVSPEIAETFFQVPNPVSIYRSYLSDKVIVDLWRESFQQYRDDLQELASMGMKDLFALIHMWQKYGYDNGLPSAFPAGDSFGGEAGLREVVDICESNGYLFALHTNYVDFYENSDVWNGDDVAFDSEGTWIKAWYNPITGIQSYLLKPSRALFYANLYEPLIHQSYRTNSCFLDVHSSVLPSSRVDYDARVAESGKQFSTFEYYRNLFSFTRSIHSGPVVGEGFGSSTSIWAGYIDAVEADPRSIFSPRGGTGVPLIVDYKLKVLHKLFVPHGAGYLERFYPYKWSGYSIDELERYRITEIAFGNAGFIHNPFLKGIPAEEVLREYCLLKHIQHYYLSETPVEILYRIDDDLLTLSDALRTILPGITPENIDTILNEELAMLKITYSRGFTIYVNRSTSKSWDIVAYSVLYTLPPNGFLAFNSEKREEFLAYTAVVNGVKRDYIYLSEPICCTIIQQP